MSIPARTCPTCHTGLAPSARECPRCHTRVNSLRPLTDYTISSKRAVCEFHPDRPASVVCGGCRKPLCASCEICIFGQSYCQRCVYVYVDLPGVFSRLARESAERVRLAHEQERIAGELRIAHEMQSRMLPQAPPAIAGLDIAGCSEPCREVGGDYFDYWLLPEGALAFCIGDVTGKGVPAALLMAMVKSCLFSLINTDPSPARVLTSLAQMVRALGDRNQLMTFLFGIIHPQERVVRFANAGHLYPYLLRAPEGSVRFLEASGLPLGAPFDSHYEDVEYQLEPDDRVIFATDGIVEARNTAGEMLGFERLESVIASTRHQTSQETVHSILSGVRQFVGRQPVDDDATLVVMRFDTSHRLDTVDDSGAARPREEAHAAG